MPLPSTHAPPAPPAAASLFTHDGATLAYALPAAAPRALLLVAHGCRNSGRNWFASAPTFGSPVRSSLPEESCVTAHALAAGFAVLAPTASADCWSAADLAPVEALVRAWGASQPGLPSTLPLFAYGTSSGGYFAHLAARQWASLAAVSMTVSAPPLAEVQSPQPRGKAYPPLQLLYMQRDTGKAKEVKLLLETAWPGKPEVEALICAPRVVTPLYFTERAALSSNHSSAVRAALLAAGHLKPDGHVASHPQRGAWRAAVQGALPKRERAGLPAHSLQAAMDAVFQVLDRHKVNLTRVSIAIVSTNAISQELDVAYGYHAATCEHIAASLAFFERHMPSRPGAAAAAAAARPKASATAKAAPRTKKRAVVTSRRT